MFIICFNSLVSKCFPEQMADIPPQLHPHIWSHAPSTVAAVGRALSRCQQRRCSVGGSVVPPGTAAMCQTGGEEERRRNGERRRGEG